MHIGMGQVIVLPTYHASDDNNNTVNRNALKKSIFCVLIVFRSKLKYSSAVWTQHLNIHIFNV